MGPLGIPIGATAGGLYAYRQNRGNLDRAQMLTRHSRADLRSPFSGKFKSAAVIIRDEMTEEEKNRLVMHITEAFREFRPEDAAVLVGLIMTNQTVVVSRVVQFLVSEMRMQVID